MCVAAYAFRSMLTLDRITIYPVKSLDGVDLTECGVLACGALENDRRWRLVDMDGRVVNAKRTARFHAIRAEYDLAERLITLSRWADGPTEPARTFPLAPGPEGPCEWLSEALGMRVLLEERYDGGFPDDREAPGPTLVSTASLAEVARWFGFGVAEARRRFRVNLEIGGCDAFWEDTLASPARTGVPSLADLPADLGIDPYADLPPLEPREFAIGDVRFRAAGVCKRCPVPSRDSRTGDIKELFREVFEARRSRGLRADVDAGRWGDLYRLGVNTRLAMSDASKPLIVVGMPLTEV
jgi:uncharacterized protein YcbX